MVCGDVCFAMHGVSRKGVGDGLLSDTKSSQKEDIYSDLH